MENEASANLARNIKQLRESRSYTQQQLSKISGIPRPTWANLESGSANPTLAVLTKVAAALQVSIEELIAPPRAQCRLYEAGSLPIKKRGTVQMRQLLPDPIPGMEMDRLEFPVGGHMIGSPHTPGTREYLTCESGQIELVASGEKYVVNEGDVLVFRGDQNHSYRNVGRKKAVAYSVVALAPAT